MALVVLLVSGCASVPEFQPPPYAATNFEQVPPVVQTAFANHYPTGQIESIESRTWEADGQHYRFLFQSQGEPRVIAFQQDGTVINGTDRARDFRK